MAVTQRGSLKIFLGYAAGVGKTFAMLKEAQELKDIRDVVVGYIEPHPRPETFALLEGLEHLAPEELNYRGKVFSEVPLDEILQRQPEIVLIDELAHTNIPIRRHVKRYGDIEELLAHGIDVYTTINIQHIESLHDLVEGITGIQVKERVPDVFLDKAAQLKVVDIEPVELLQRLQQGKIYRREQAEKAQRSFFTLTNLQALREIAFRRAADTLHAQTNEQQPIEEHLLMGISSSPTNARVIRTTARLAQALRGKWTALYVQSATNLSHANQERLERHFQLIEQLGGDIVVVHDEDIAIALSNYAKISGVTKLVIGRTMLHKKWWSPNNKISDKLAEHAPSLALYIIPDEEHHHFEKPSVFSKKWLSLVDISKLCIVFTGASAVGLLLDFLGTSEVNLVTLYILAVLLIALWTEGSAVSLLSSMIAVLLFNFLFTEPRLSFEAYNTDYPITFAITFIAAFITSSLMKKIKWQARSATRKAYRTEILLDTNRQLQAKQSSDDIIHVALTQMMKLVDCPLQFYDTSVQKGQFVAATSLTANANAAIQQNFNSSNEKGVVSWVLHNQKPAGISTNIFREAQAYYVPLLRGNHLLGIVAIALSKEQPLETFEKGILHALLNDLTLALSQQELRLENEQIHQKAHVEQMRSQLLRAISHDLRTPLTSIAGNADLLQSASQKLTQEQKETIATTIFNDAHSLIQMVENVLAVSRLEQDQLALEMEDELVEDLLQEALQRVSSIAKHHHIQLHLPKQLLFVRVDVRLIIQLFVNLLDNALHYTPPTSTIDIYVREQEKEVSFSFVDNGPGIPTATKAHLFEPFMTGLTHGDTRRGLGLGLSLCQSIALLHQSHITVADNDPSGAVFNFTLLKGRAVDDDSHLNH